MVTATRVAESSFDIPASINRVDQATIQTGQLQVNISESLITVPGVSAENRQNYAQDLQLSVRGFGARSSFGVRGVRLYSDGIPGTMPDGQGQFSQFDLGSAGRMEVLRGPFSALYGNSSGGVISIFTEDAKPGYFIDGSAQYGTFNTQRYALMTTGDDGTINYVVDAAHFQTDGYRFHSNAERNNFNSKLRINLSDAAKLDAGGQCGRNALRPGPPGTHGGAGRRQSESGGHRRRAYNTRKSLDQQQIGAMYENKLNSAGCALEHALHGPSRDHAISSDTPSDGGRQAAVSGRSDRLDRDFWGIDAHVTDQRTLGRRHCRRWRASITTTWKSRARVI